MRYKLTISVPVESYPGFDMDVMQVKEGLLPESFRTHRISMDGHTAFFEAEIEGDSPLWPWTMTWLDRNLPKHKGRLQMWNL